MSVDNSAQVENVVIEEPSDKQELAHDEKSCISRKHIYVAVGLLLVLAVSLIGTLLSFSPANTGGIDAQSLTEGTTATFPTFDTNNDGYIDQGEMGTWMNAQIAARCNDKTSASDETTQTVSTCNAGNSSTTCNTATTASVQSVMQPCDFNHDGRISLAEAIKCVILAWEAIINSLHDERPAPNSELALMAGSGSGSSNCPVPTVPGFRGHTPEGYVGACDPSLTLTCMSHHLCNKKDKCHRTEIDVTWTVTDQCCGSNQAANCSTCACGKTYKYVTHGPHVNLCKKCAHYSHLMCGDYDTGVTTWC